MFDAISVSIPQSFQTLLVISKHSSQAEKTSEYFTCSCS